MATTKYAMTHKVPPGPWTPYTAETINQLFERLYEATQIAARATDSIGALANGLDLIVPATGDMIVCTSAGIFVALPLVTTAQRVLTNNGGTPTWALVDVTTGVTGLLALANLVNATTTQVLLGRNTAGSGVFQEVTLTQLLDWIGSAAQGDILYRGASGWARLGAGTAGYFLQTAGAGADPVYAPISGANLPLATASHLEYTFDDAGAWRNNRGQSASPTGTTIAYPAAGSILAIGQYFQLGTAATINSSAQATSVTSVAVKELSFAWNFDITWIVLTDAAAVTTVRYMIGVGINNENADPVIGNYIGFRFDTSATNPGNDTKWVGITFNGAQSVTAGIGSAVAANTRYVLRARKVSGTVFFSVNGGTEVSTSTDVPVNNVYASIGIRVTTLANAVRSLWFSRLWCDFGT